ncbi:MAG TPA: PASTA domain-containing protein [Nocardioides sp.]|nr:PASTA domain-containing protein [Nocardioides sp.]
MNRRSRLVDAAMVVVAWLLLAGCDDTEATPSVDATASRDRDEPSKPAEAVMPQLVGLPYAEGEALLGRALDAAGFTGVIQARTRVTGTAPPGTFVAQDPPAGTALKPTTKVWIYVETTPATDPRHDKVSSLPRLLSGGLANRLVVTQSTGSGAGWE